MKDAAAVLPSIDHLNVPTLIAVTACQMCRLSATSSFIVPLTQHQLVWTQGAQEWLGLTGAWNCFKAC